METPNPDRNRAFFIGKVIGVLVLLLAGWSIVSTLLSAPNTFAVWLGAGGVCVLVAVAFYACRDLWKDAKRLFPIAVALLAIVGGAGCTYVEPGWVGVLVNRTGTYRGVDDVPIVTGRVFYNPVTTGIYPFPTFLQQERWTKDQTEGSPGDQSVTFGTAQGTTINADIYLAYTLGEQCIPAMFLKHRKGYQYITDVYMRSLVRGALQRRAEHVDVISLYAGGRGKLLDQVKDDLNRELNDYTVHKRDGTEVTYHDCIVVTQVEFIGNPRPPQNVQDAINAVIKAAQEAKEAEQVVARRRAEANQKIEVARGDAESRLINAKAEAEANREVAASITEQLVAWRALDRWNGALPTTMPPGGSVPFLSLPTPHAQQ